MARDGISRGGPRVGTGKKRKALAENILEGKAESGASNELDSPTVLEAEDMPPISEYLTAQQKNGGDLEAKDVFRDTWRYLKKIRCEKAISEYGFIAKHPTTGAAIASPYVAMSREYVSSLLRILLSSATYLAADV